MELNLTPKSQRIHIGFFGLRNAGKSSLVNAITAQNISIVSDIKGTTTDPVYKSMELLPLGPVTIIDTPGLDDTGELGNLRIEKTKQVLRKTDIAILVTDASKELNSLEKEIISIFQNMNLKYVIAYNKADLIEKEPHSKQNEIYVSAKNNTKITELKELIASIPMNEEKKLIDGIVSAGDCVVLVTPIDSAAPKGRLILPQQQVLRELLDKGAVSVVVREFEYEKALKALKIKPKLVITDSQVFQLISNLTPQNIYLTSFSILFARKKGILLNAVKGVKTLETLKDNDCILISEGCSHHRQCDDIGSVKLPNWIQKYTGKNLNFEFTSGTSFPEKLDKYSLVIHCGGCMLNDREVNYRYESAIKQNIPITNYGITIAYINNILERSIEVFPEIKF